MTLHQQAAQQLANDFMAAAMAHQAAPLQLIDELVERALQGSPESQQLAVQALYGAIVLPLCDDFASSSTFMADQVLARITSLYRTTPFGRQTDQLLNRYGLEDEQQMLARLQRLRRNPPVAGAQIKKVFIPSRVTIGADIVLLSPIIQRLQQVLPQAEIILLGPGHLGELFSGQVRFLHCHFPRHTLLKQRLSHWPVLHHLIASQRQGLADHELLLLDPDSRLSQLGLLPLLPESCCRLLPSRLDHNKEMSLSSLCNQWLDQLFPGSTASSCRFWLSSEQIEQSRAFFKHFPTNTFKIVANFGVGGDEKKRLSDPFEQQVLQALLQLDNTVVFLDSGSDDQEQLRISNLRHQLARHSPASLVLQGHAPEQQQGLIQFIGSIGALAGLIDQADLFIGYDSCSQHLATATSTPALICFAGAPHERFFRRWHPQANSPLSKTLFIDQQSEQAATELVKMISSFAQQIQQDKQQAET